MQELSKGLADVIDGGLGARWNSRRHALEEFLQGVGLANDAFSQALMIFPKATDDPEGALREIERSLSEGELWATLTGVADGMGKIVVCFPVAKELDALSKAEAMRAPFVEVHSRLIAWWLVNAWRSVQLARAAWHLGDTFQIIPASACGRSLMETAAAFWLEMRAIRKTWQTVKLECARTGPNLNHWRVMSIEIYKMMWGSKFDEKASPGAVKLSTTLPRQNVLTQLEKLAKATDAPVQEDYQWLCNAVHPSLGGMLSFAVPLMVHSTGTHGFQYVSADPMYIDSASKSEKWTEATIQEALARSSILAVDVLCRALDDGLKMIDDVALTTGAPRLASFDYWRKLTPPRPGALCPCRSGKSATKCEHTWATALAPITERFEGYSRTA